MLNLFGDLYPIGSYRSLVFNHETSRNVRIGFRAKPPVQIRHYRNHSFRLILDRSEAANDTAVWWEFEQGKNDIARLVQLQLKSMSGLSARGMRRQGRGGPFQIRATLKREGQRGRPASIAVDAGFDVLFPRLLLGDRPRVRRRAQFECYNALEESFIDCRLTLEHIRAIGAFRQPPEREYRLVAGIPGGIDLVGQYAVHRIIESMRSQAGTSRGFVENINSWLNRLAGMTISNARDKIDIRSFGINVKPTRKGRTHNIADVGFGVSQAIPVLAAGLSATKGSTLLVQQPEIHLHPDAQLVMADFLVSVMQRGVQVIVETHSEHMLLRMRRRMLARAPRDGVGNELRPQDVLVLVVAGEGSSVGANVTTIQLDQLGRLGAWPKGFMEEATEERMDLLELQSKRAVGEPR